ncbi:MAG: hypothetical protein ABOK23_03715 [Candidatus Methanoperedens sp.]|nr:hypothetical protein [Candidatus Methanoperedens sp.]MCZ7394260.1 hypothetical protein [Candidatus Methanoperedens sp.]
MVFSGIFKIAHSPYFWFIESENTRIDHTITKIEKEIALLLEYRTALISEVVTGKIDVREAI